MTTWSDGENGGWFRQTHEPSGFFGHFFAPAMERVRGGKSDVIPVTLSAYLGRHPPTTEAQVQTGAWNIGSSAGYDFSRWIGSPPSIAPGMSSKRSAGATGNCAVAGPASTREAAPTWRRPVP